MKRWLLSLVVLLLVAGCDQNSKLDPNTIRALAASTEALTVRMDDYQASAKAVVSEMQRYGITDANMVAKAAKLNAEIDRVQPQVAAIARAVSNAQYGDDAGINLINALSAANTASAPFNPYALPIGAGLSLLSVILGLFARKKSSDAAVSDAKYQAHKSAVEGSIRALAALPESDVTVTRVSSLIYDRVGEARKALGVMA